MRRPFALVALAIVAASPAGLAGCGPKKDAAAAAPVAHDPHPPVSTEVPEAGEPSICGEVRIAPSLAAKVPKDATLFVFAKSHTGGGPPSAAMRATVTSFPISFCLSKKDTMAPGVEFAGKLFLTARIDLDGNAGGAPGDLEGVTREPVAVGSNGVVLLIDTVRS